MRAVEVRIPGEFWDSFIYNGRLYLFTVDGEIFVYRWDQIIESLKVAPNCAPLFWQFLTRGQSWYMPEMQKILESPAMRQMISSLADDIVKNAFEVSEKLMRPALISNAESPMHPHSDVEAFYNMLYISSPAGVSAASLRRKLSGGFRRLTDLPTLRISCAYSSMALAAGSEGIYDQQLSSTQDWSRPRSPRRLSDRNCIACNWADFDVVGTSGSGEAGFIAAFEKPQKKEENSEAISKTMEKPRHLLDVIGSDDLFQSSDGLMFGSQDLLVMASRSTLQIENWNPWLGRERQGVDVQKSLFGRHTVRIKDLTEEAIDGSAAVFGIIVEMDSSLLVSGVDGTIASFGEPVSWRIFPRSRRYLNQLHVTYEGYISIFAFIEDYFIPIDTRGPAVHRPEARSR